MDKFRFHSRHIPEHHLNMDTPAAKKVKGNLLCDALKPENASILRESGVRYVETRVVWWELERQKGVLDWSALDESIDRIEQEGLLPGVFAWFMHPPEWEHTLVRAKCLEHGLESSIPSLWDPGLLDVYDRLYAALAKRYGDRIKFLYFSIYGDFGETQYPHDTKHYLFSSTDAHIGYWCGDALARADFRSYLQKCYPTLEDLNRAWDTDFTGWDQDLMPRLPLCANKLERRIDFRAWYIGSLSAFTDRVCALIRRYFPNVYAGIPIGTLHEGTEAGQIKSLAVKVSAPYLDLVRWTGLINEQDFGIMNIPCQRVASAVRFYSKCKFGTEAALELSSKAANHVIYSNLSCGSHVLHNDLTNILRGWEHYNHWKDRLEELPVHCTNALFYPLEGEQLECMEPEQRMASSDCAGIVANESEGVLENALTKEYYRQAAHLREVLNYEITDSLMIDDGYLCGMKDLFIAARCPLYLKTAQKILEWVKNGGRLWYRSGALPWILETGEDLPQFAAFLGYGSCGTAVTEWPAQEPYASIRRKHAGEGETLYSTLHGARYSVYLPERGEISMHDMAQL